MNPHTMRDIPRFALTVFVMLLLGYAVWNHYSPAIEQTIVSIAILAVGYWLGSSKGSADKNDLLSERPTGTMGDPVSVDIEKGR